MKKRIFALLLAFCLLSPLFPQNVFSIDVIAYGEEAYFTDMNNHWALETVTKWVKSGLVSGYTDKTFRPDQNISRAEFCVIIDSIFGFQDLGSASFNDVKASDWYSRQILRVKEAGIIEGYNNNFDPNSPITRQDAAVIVQKAFELVKADDTAAKNIADYSSITDYAKEAISTLVSKGYIKGFGDNTIKPLKNLSRAEAVAIIDNVAGRLLNQKGLYSSEVVTGNLLINTPDVTIKDLTIKGNLYLTEGIGEGDVTIDNVEVEGATYVKGGGSNSVIIKNSRLSDIIVKKKNNNVRLSLEGNTKVTSVKLVKKGKVEFSEQTTINKIEIEKEAEGTVLAGTGNVSTIDVKAENVLINDNIVQANTEYKMEDGEVKDQNDVVVVPRPSPTAQVTSLPTATGSVGDSSTPRPASTPRPTSASPYTLVWSDEFNETSLNTNNWTAADTGVVYNNELEAYKPDNVYLENGKLVLEAKVEEYKGKAYTSGKVVTKGKQAWTYGRFEIRAKMPESQGIWPAIWMLPEDDNIFGGWPQGGEIDILELLGHEPNKIYGTIHYGNPHASGQGEYTLENGKFSDGYHLYAFEWDPNEMRWYIDGQLYYTENNWYSRDVSEADSLTYPAPFNRDFHLIMNLAVGGDWPGNPDETTVLPSKMYVDYVRVYERNGGIYPPAGERPESNDSDARPPLEDGNYIYNGSFDEQVEGVDGMVNDGETDEVPNTSYWTFSHVEANNGVAVASNDNGALKLEISEPGNNTYSVQVYQKPINLEKSDSYRVTFDAWASTGRNITVKVGSEGPGWINYSGDRTIAITTTQDTYTFDFKMTGDTNPAARIEFNVGAAGANTVWIDNVKVEKLPRDPNAPRDILPSGNLIYNGSFDQGSKSMGFWEFSTSDGATAKGYVTDDIYNREFQVAITNEGEGPDSIVLSQSGLNIENSKQYSVSFYARATDERNIEVDVCSTEETPVVYATQQFNLSTEMTRYSFRFTMEEDTDTKAQLRFKFGGDDTKVYIDNVSMRSVLPGQYIHVEAETADAHGALTSHGSYVTFGEEAYITKSITVPESGDYVISYMLSTSGNDSWLSVADAENNREELPNTGGKWVSVTNSISLEEGTYEIAIYGNAVNLDWFEISKDLVRGGHMSPSAANWVYWNTAEENAVSTKSVEDGKLKVAITKAGVNPWSIGVNQPGISLEQGKMYRISFDAQTTEARSIRVSIDKADYTQYFVRDLEITDTTMKNYIIDFAMSADDTNSTLSFSIGNVSGGIANLEHELYLDNIRLAEISDIFCMNFQSIDAPVIPEPVIPEPEEAGVVNLIPDGTFETIGAWGSYDGVPEGEGAGAISLNVVDGKLVADVTTVGTANYKPQVSRNGLSLSQGKTYILTFNASASVDRALEVSIIDPSDSYRYYGGSKYILSTTGNDYAFLFTAPATTDSASLQFNLGRIDGYESTSVAALVSFDDVCLVEVDNLINGTEWSKYDGENNPGEGIVPGEVSIGEVDGKLKVDVTNVGSANNAPQIKTGSFSLVENGKYVITFGAIANTDRAVELAILDPGRGWAWYGGTKYTLSTEDSNYTFLFTSPATTDTAELQFNFGTIEGFGATSVAATVYLNNVVITPVYLPEIEVSNELINETFDANAGVWNLSENGGAASAGVLNNELKVDVTTVGAENYQPQLVASNIRLEAGASYTFTFKAKAETPRGIEIGVIDPGNGYHYYGGSSFDLTGEYDTYTVSFTADIATSTGQVQINFGTISGKTSVPAIIYIDDTVLTKN